jgi:hypothetical protein
MIGPNVVIPWYGTHAAIPAGYVRETDLDGKFPKAAATGNNPNTTGGSSTHTHTSPSHTHTMVSHTHAITTTVDFNNSFGHSGFGGSASDVHSHSGTISGVVDGSMSGTVAYGAFSNNPPYFEVIFIRSISYSNVPPDGILYWGTEDDAPDGFHDTDGADGSINVRDRYLRAAGTGANSGATGGTRTNVHDITHGHGAVSHSHFAALGGANSSDRDLGTGDGPPKAPSSHTHNITLDSKSETPADYSGTAGSAETVEPAYYKLRALQNISGVKKAPRPGMIAMTRNNLDRIPPGWVLCNGANGTPDLRDKYVKVVNITSEVGDTGGANTHTHALGDAHTHTAPASHDHSGSVARFTAVSGGTASAATNAIQAHDHNLSGVGVNTSSWNTAQTSANSANNEPEYRTYLFIQFKYSLGAPLAALL